MGQVALQIGQGWSAGEMLSMCSRVPQTGAPSREMCSVSVRHMRHGHTGRETSQDIKTPQAPPDKLGHLRP